MGQFLTYGSVRGASGNGRPYRDKVSVYLTHIIREWIENSWAR